MNFFLILGFLFLTPVVLISSTLFITFVCIALKRLPEGCKIVKEHMSHIITCMHNGNYAQALACTFPVAYALFLVGIFCLFIGIAKYDLDNRGTNNTTTEIEAR